MRTKILMVAVVGTILGLGFQGCTVFAQTEIAVPEASAPVASAAREDSRPTPLDVFLADLPKPTNGAVEAYFTYAPKAPQHYGGGVLGIWNVDKYVGIGLGLDWLGQLSLVSGNLQLQAPFHPLANWFPNLLLDPFVLGGVGSAYSGAGKFNGGVSTISDVGVALKFGHAAGGEFNVGAAWGQWTGVGPYDVKRYHFILGWSHGI